MEQDEGASGDWAAMQPGSSKAHENIEIDDDIEVDDDENSYCDSQYEVVLDSDECDVNWRCLSVAQDDADPVCKKLNQLIKEGKIPKDRILYKYLNDVVDTYYDPWHEYDDDVKEFFGTIIYLGGEKTYNFIRGPMGYGQGRNVANVHKRGNLHGPGHETLRKKKAEYTTANGVWKYLTELHYSLLTNKKYYNGAPLYEDLNIKAYPVAFGNDGTALKPCIQLDEKRCRNVGIEGVELTLKYCEDHPFIEKDLIAKKIVCEAVVSSVTTLDEDLSLPVAIKYSAKKGKTGNDMKKLFCDQIKTIQMCDNCLRREKAVDYIVSNPGSCSSYCELCYKTQKVCDNCASYQSQYYPQLRRCNYCVEHDLICIKRVVMVISVDCESGNKLCLNQLQKEVIDGTTDPELALLTFFPDVPHVLKTTRCCFSNWHLQIENERGNLAIFYTLRNRADPEVKKKVTTFLKKNDDVRNRDRQNPDSVLSLCDPGLLEYVSSLGYVSHTIVPETIRFTKSNKRGSFPSIIDVAVAPYGRLLFLCGDGAQNNLFRFQLRNPVDNIESIEKNLIGNRLTCFKGVAYIYKQSSPIQIISVDKKNQLCFSLTSLKKKAHIQNACKEIGLSTKGTAKECKLRLETKQKQVMKLYKEKQWSETTIVFEEDNTLIDSLAFYEDVLYVAISTSNCFAKCVLKKNSVGLYASVEPLMQYIDNTHVLSMAFVADGRMCVGTDQGIYISDMDLTSLLLGFHDHQPQFMTSFKDGLLFSTASDTMVFRYFPDTNEISTLTGGQDSGSRDGTASYARFYRPCGIATEFDHVVYIADEATGSIKLVTTLVSTSKFLRAVGSVGDAFSLHKKHETYQSRSLSEAIDMMKCSKDIFMDNIEAIRRDNPTYSTLNGPEGSVSTATVQSYHLLLWSMEQLQKNVQQFNYNDVNLLSCVTLSLENLHSTTNRKQGTLTMLSHAQSFAESVKESLKGVTDWGVYYFTSRERWYPLPPNSLPFKALKFPLRTRCQNPLTKDEKHDLREWASINGAVVRQRSCRQETTMARAGTLPQNAYFEELRPLAETAKTKKTKTRSQTKQSDAGRRSLGEAEDDEDEEDEDMDEELSEEEEEEEEELEEMLRYSSTGESEEDELDESDDEDLYNSVSQVGRESTFLIGSSSRYGRSVRINQKFLD